MLSSLSTPPRSHVRTIHIATSLAIMALPHLSTKRKNDLFAALGVTPESKCLDVLADSIVDIATNKRNLEKLRLTTSGLQYCVYAVAHINSNDISRILAIHYSGSNDTAEKLLQEFAVRITKAQEESGNLATIVTAQNIAHLSAPENDDRLRRLQIQTWKKVEDIFTTHNLPSPHYYRIASTGPVIYNPTAHTITASPFSIQPERIIAAAQSQGISR